MVGATHVAERHSTDAFAIEDQAVVQALRYIGEQVLRPIQVNEVATAVSVSRRTLENKFRENLSRTVHQEIKRVRINQIAQMLLETNYSVVKVAETMNFSNVAHLSRYFLEGKGISPQAYRNKHGAG